MKHTAYLGLGSNTANSADMISCAIGALRTFGVKVMDLSKTYQTESPYLNAVAFIESELDYPQLLAVTKDMEGDMGRKPEMKSRGVVPIDIDIVVFDGIVKRHRDFDASYFSVGYEQLHGVAK